MDTILLHFLIFTIAAIIFVPLFRRLQMGAIVGYMFAGVIIGPHLTGLITDTKFIMSFSELGLVFLWFFIGLELTPSRIWRLRRWIFGLGVCQVLATGLILMATSYFLGWSLGASYVIGFGLALSSTAFAMQLLKEHHQFNTTHGQGSFSILMFQDLAIIPLLTSLSFFTDGQLVLPTLNNILQIIAIIIALILIEQYVISHILHLVAASQTQEVFTAMSLLLVIGAALLFETVGLNMGMGAFVAGLLLTKSEYRHEFEINLNPFKGLLMGLFFISVGMSLNLQVLLSSWYFIILITLGFMTFKASIIFALGHLFRFPKQSIQNMSFTLPQGGEFSFILFSSALSKGVMDIELSSILTASVIMSMAITPFVFSLNQKFLPIATDNFESHADKNKINKKLDKEVEVIIAGFGRFGQIVSRFLRTEGIKYTILEHSASQVKAARKFNNAVYYGDASRADIVKAAGGDQAKVFVLAIDDVDKSTETAKMILKSFPHLKIIARCRHRRHAMDLFDLGVSRIHQEVYLSGLEVAKEILLLKGCHQEVAHLRLARFRKYDEKLFQRQLHSQHGRETFVSFTHQVNQDLIDLLEEDEKQTLSHN